MIRLDLLRRLRWSSGLQGPLPRASPHSAVASAAIFYGAVGSIGTADGKRPDKVTKKASGCPAVSVQVVGERKGDDSSALLPVESDPHPV